VNATNANEEFRSGRRLSGLLSLRAWVRRACLVVAVFSLAAPALAEARAGLDPSFGNGGRAATSLDFTEKIGGAAELGIAPDGSVVVAETGSLVRFRADGSRDLGFGPKGRVVLKASAAAEGVAERSFLASNMSVDRRGRILVFGTQNDARESYEGFAYTGLQPASLAIVFRFSAAGEPDPSFGGRSGFVRGDFGLPPLLGPGFPMVSAMAGGVDSRDRPILVAGVRTVVRGCYAKSSIAPQPKALVRLTDSGTPDPSFGGGDGISPLEGSGYFGLGIDGTDRTVVDVDSIGGSPAGCGSGSALIRLGRDGERSPEFGEGGVRTLGGGSLYVAERSGAMILARSLTQATALFRLKADGTLDQSFGGDGSTRVALPPRAHVKPVAVDGRGRVILAGWVGAEAPKRSYFVVTRLHADGTLDPRFGDRGWIKTPFDRPLRLSSAAAELDSRGRLLVAGTVSAPYSGLGGFVVARYLLGP
jgi:uncharacterized delta-60 repeat protein